MDNNTLFINASRGKFRFGTSKGELTTEDLWDLSLDSLDRIAVALDEKLGSKKSFIGKRDTSATEVEAKLEVVKAVIATKMDEAAKAKTRATRLSERQFLTDLLDKKKTEQLQGLTADEIKARIAALDTEESAAA